jgi:hypothetical protein
VILDVVALAVMCTGVVVLVRSPLVADIGGTAADEYLSAARDPVPVSELRGSARAETGEELSACARRGASDLNHAVVELVADEDVALLIEAAWMRAMAR